MTDQELYNKMINSKLNPKELAEFKERVSSLSDESLNNLIDSSEMSSVYPSEATLENMYANIHVRIGQSRKRPLKYRVLSYAAIIILPLLLGCTIFFYIKSAQLDDYSQLLASEIKISTSEDERLTVLMPDGSTAALEPMSELEYSMKDFNNNGRTVNFSGTAFFNIVNKGGIPFNVDSKDLKVIVKGTSFMFSARMNEESAGLFLESGKVKLISRISGMSVSLVPGDLALLCYPGGDFFIRKADNRNDANAIMRGDLIFYSCSIDSIMSKIADVYSLEYLLENKGIINKPFTGYLPSNNLDEAISIIEYAFKCKISSKDKTLIIK